MRKKRKLVTKEIREAAWAAEDGRCEVCKRPMDRRIAHWLPIDPDKDVEGPDDIHCACFDCRHGQPDFLLTFIKIKKPIIHKLQKRMKDPPSNLDHWLAQNLREHGVLVDVNKQFRLYWLPRVGVFQLRKTDLTENGLPVREVFKCQIYHDAKLVVQPQRKTRGLPRPALRLK